MFGGKFLLNSVRELPQFIMHTGLEQKHTGHKVFLVLQSTGQKVFSASILRGTYFFYISHYGAQTFLGSKYEMGENWAIRWDAQKNSENSQIHILAILGELVGFRPIYYMKHYIETLCSD